jgi:hypothetical protein
MRLFRSAQRASSNVNLGVHSGRTGGGVTRSLLLAITDSMLSTLPLTLKDHAMYCQDLWSDRQARRRY